MFVVSSSSTCASVHIHLSGVGREPSQWISFKSLREVYFLRCLQVEELVTLSLNQPVRLFVDNNTDVAHNLRQEFVRIRSNRENDRLAIVTGV